MKVHLYSKKHPRKNPHAFFFFFLSMASTFVEQIGFGLQMT